MICSIVRKHVYRFDSVANVCRPCYGAQVCYVIVLRRDASIAYACRRISKTESANYAFVIRTVSTNGIEWVL